MINQWTGHCTRQQEAQCAHSVGRRSGAGQQRQRDHVKSHWALVRLHHSGALPLVWQGAAPATVTARAKLERELGLTRRLNSCWCPSFKLVTTIRYTRRTSRQAAWRLSLTDSFNAGTSSFIDINTSDVRDLLSYGISTLIPCSWNSNPLFM